MRFTLSENSLLSVSARSVSLTLNGGSHLRLSVLLLWPGYLQDMRHAVYPSWCDWWTTPSDGFDQSFEVCSFSPCCRPRRSLSSLEGAISRTLHDCVFLSCYLAPLILKRRVLPVLPLPLPITT